MDLSTLSKETLIQIINDLRSQLHEQKHHLNIDIQSKKNILSKKELIIHIPVKPSIVNQTKNLYIYNLAQKKHHHKDKMLYDFNDVYIGIDDSYTNRFGGFDNYFQKIKHATHIITYKSKKEYGNEGGVFKDIFELKDINVIKDFNTFKEKSNYKPGVNMSYSAWRESEQWFEKDINSCCIYWKAKLVKEIEIPYKNSGLTTRNRFGFVKHSHEIYSKF